MDIRWCSHQVHALSVLKGADERDDVLVALEVVHDLHLPPHILHILLRPAHVILSIGRDASHQMLHAFGAVEPAIDWSMRHDCLTLPRDVLKGYAGRYTSVARCSCVQYQQGGMIRISQQLALGDRLAGKVLSGLLVCCQACDPKLPSPQDLAQGIEVVDILQRLTVLGSCSLHTVKMHDRDNCDLQLPKSPLSAC